MDSIPGIIDGFGRVNYEAILIEFGMRGIEGERRAALYGKAKEYVRAILEVINKD